MDSDFGNMCTDQTWLKLIKDNNSLDIAILDAVLVEVQASSCLRMCRLIVVVMH